MIYTVTINPAIDHRIYVEKFPEEGSLSRAKKSTASTGGKGVNVSLILKRLGISTKALGFVAGNTGYLIEKGLADDDVSASFVRLSKGETRINTKIIIEDGEGNISCTEINGQGPSAFEKDLEALISLFGDVNEDDMVIFSGSIVNGLKNDVYEVLLEQAVLPRKARFAVDACGELLLSTLKHRPFLVKPNLEELQEIAGRTLSDDEEIKSAATSLIEKGASNVIVSMGEKGAMFISEDGTFCTYQTQMGKAADPVGAGDALVAGFFAGLEKGLSKEEAFVLGARISEYTAMGEGIPEKFRKFN